MRAFFDDLGPASADVTVMVSTEFGRRVAQNGTGADHGHGSVVIVLSGKPVAGSLLGAWGGLGSLDNGDVPEFNNLFDVFGSVMKGRFELTDAEVARVFPSRTFTPDAGVRDLSAHVTGYRRGSGRGRPAYRGRRARTPSPAAPLGGRPPVAGRGHVGRPGAQRRAVVVGHPGRRR